MPMSIAAATMRDANPARWPCIARARSRRLLVVTAPLSTSSWRGRLRSSSRSTILAVKQIEVHPLLAQRVGGLRRDARGRLADHADEVDSRDDGFDVEVGDDLVDRNLLHDAHEVDLRDDVLGDPLDEHGHERRRLRLIALLLAPGDLVEPPQRVLDRPERPAHDARPRDDARHTGAPAHHLVDDDRGHPLDRDRHPRDRAGQQRGGRRGRVGRGAPAGGRDPSEEAAGRPPGEPDRPEAHLGAAPEHLGRARHRGFDGLGHGLHDGHGPPG